MQMNRSVVPVLVVVTLVAHLQGCSWAAMKRVASDDPYIGGTSCTSSRLAPVFDLVLGVGLIALGGYHLYDAQHPEPDDGWDLEFVDPAAFGTTLVVAGAVPLVSSVFGFCWAADCDEAKDDGRIPLAWEPAVPAPPFADDFPVGVAGSD